METQVGFYHCTRAPAGDVAVRLAAKAWESRQRLVILGDDTVLTALDRALWVQDAASFLPHAVAGGLDDAAQPILLAETADAPANGARLLMLVGRALPANFTDYDRVLMLFDEGSEVQPRARLDWKAVDGREGVTRTYWQQTATGGWEKKR